MSNQLICGIDLLPGSERAAGTAATLARELEYNAVLVHVVQAHELFGDGGELSEGQRHALRELRELVEAGVSGDGPAWIQTRDRRIMRSEAGSRALARVAPTPRRVVLCRFDFGVSAHGATADT